MRVLLIVIFSYFFVVPVSSANEQTCVILLHGLGRSHYSMSSMASVLKKYHFEVVNQNYSSTQKSIEDIAAFDLQPMVERCMKNHTRNIVFITHSLGGIILQRYLEHHEVKQLTHIVMLSPPNHGSPIVDIFQNYWIFKQLLGPAGQVLSTQKMKPILFPAQRSYQVMIIAGNANLTPFSRYFFKDEPNDGKVSVKSAYMEGIDEFVIYPVSHTFMMNNASVQRRILSFISSDVRMMRAK